MKIFAFISLQYVSTFVLCRPQKERAANPRGLMAKLGGDDFEAPSHLMVPDFIEPAATQEEEEDEEEITPSPSPEVQPLSQVITCSRSRLQRRMLTQFLSIEDGWQTSMKPSCIVSLKSRILPVRHRGTNC